VTWNLRNKCASLGQILLGQGKASCPNMVLKLQTRHPWEGGTETVSIFSKVVSQSNN